MNGPLEQVEEYKDGRTKQSFKDECDINLIMQRAAQGGTISHVTKYEGMYADFSDYNFGIHIQKLTEGREVFDALPAEVRREFGQSPQAFFDHVNDPVNMAKPDFGLPALAKPGTQLRKISENDADTEAALAAASEPASENTSTEAPASEAPSGAAGEAP